MAVSVKGTATTAVDVDGGASSTVSVPSGGAAGDAYIVVAQSYGDGVNPGVHSATGFVVLASVVATSDDDTRIRLSVLARARDGSEGDGSEGASFTVATASGSSYTYLAAFVVAGADLTGTNLANFLDVAAATASNNSFATPAVTTDSTNALAVTATGGYQVTAAPTGWTAIALDDLDGGFMAAAAKAMPTTGTTGTNAWAGDLGLQGQARITLAVNAAVATGANISASAVDCVASVETAAVGAGVSISAGVVDSTVDVPAATVTITPSTPPAPSLTPGVGELEVDWDLPAAERVDLRWRRVIDELPELQTQTSAPWHLDRIDQRGNTTTGTYTYRYTGDGVTIYVLDSGTRRTHDEFDGRVLDLPRAFVSSDVTGGDWGGPFVDEVPHGTPGASLAGGVTYGPAKGVTLVAVKVGGAYFGDFQSAYDCDPADAGDFLTEGITTADYLAAFDWILADHAAHPGPAIITDSTTARSYTDDGLPDAHADPVAAAALEAAVQACLDAGMLLFCWGGHWGEEPHWIPATMPGTVTVGGIDTSTRRFIEEPGYESNVGPLIDIFAPAQIAAAAGPDADDDITVPGTGTSSATPIVAGVAALLLEQNPHLTPARLRQVLLAQATHDAINLQSPAYPGTPNRLLYSLASTSEWTEVDDVEAPYLLDGLEPDTEYEVEIRQWIDGEASGWSATASATTEAESTGATANPPAVDAPADVLSVTVSAGSTSTPSTVDAAIDVPAVTVSTSATAAASAVDAVVDVPVATVTSSASVTADAVELTIDVPTASVSTSADVNVEADSIDLTVDTPAPTVAASSTASQPAVDVTVEVLTPAVAAGGSAAINADCVDLAADVDTVVVAVGSTIAAVTVDAITSIDAPAAGAGAGVTAVTVEATVELLAPTVSAGGSANVTAAAVELTVDIPAGTPATGATITAAVVDAVVEVLAATQGETGIVVASVTGPTIGGPTGTLTVSRPTATLEVSS